MDEARDRRPKCFLLVGADPDEVPVGRLQAGRERRAEPGARAHPDAAFVQGRGVGDACKLELARPDRLGWVLDKPLREVALHAANEVVVLGLLALTARAS